jgi:hypothetical protein
MLEIKKTAISFEEMELIELERIILDSDREEALRYLKKNVYDKALHSQQGKLKSHLENNNSPVESFKNTAGNK